MANIDAAFGLRPYEKSGSNYNNQGINAYPLNFDGLTTGSTSKIYTGTPVIPLAGGLIDLPGNANGGTVPLLGVFMGCKYIATDELQLGLHTGLVMQRLKLQLKLLLMLPMILTHYLLLMRTEHYLIMLFLLMLTLQQQLQELIQVVIL